MKVNDINNNYDDIIDLPHHVSETRPQMAMIDRAAQFSPFAALTGYGAVIQETERLTAERAELDETAKTVLNNKLQMLLGLIGENPEVTVVYFRPDSKKSGGEYVTVSGTLQKVRTDTQQLVFSDGTTVPVADIYEIESPLYE